MFYYVSQDSVSDWETCGDFLICATRTEEVRHAITHTHTYTHTHTHTHTHAHGDTHTHTDVELLVNKPSIRMYILMLDTRNEEQTNDVRMYIEEYLF